MESIDVVLVNPGNLKAVYQALGKSLSAIEPPSLAGLFATFLRRKGYSVEIVDAPALNLAPADLAIKNGWELPDNWIGFSQHSYEMHPLRTETLTSAEVVGFRDQAFTKYFSALSYLALVQRKFGGEVHGHVREMASVPLKRKLLGH